jgi:hypothetical protein
VADTVVSEDIEEKDPLKYFSEMENDWEKPPQGGFFYAQFGADDVLVALSKNIKFVGAIVGLSTKSVFW